MKKNKAIDKYNKSIKRYNNIANKILENRGRVIHGPLEVDIDELSDSFNGRLIIRLASTCNNLFSYSFEGIELSNSVVEVLAFTLFIAIPSAIVGFVIALFVGILSSF